MKNHLDKRNNILNKKLMESWGYKREELANENEAEMLTSDDVAKFLEKKYQEANTTDPIFWSKVGFAHPDDAIPLAIEKYPDLQNVKGFKQGIEDWRGFAADRVNAGTIDDYLDSLEDPLTDDDDWGYEQDADY